MSRKWLKCGEKELLWPVAWWDIAWSAKLETSKLSGGERTQKKEDNVWPLYFVQNITIQKNWTDIWPAWQNWRHQSNLVAKEISTQKKEEILSGHYILFKTPKYKIEYEWYRSKNCSCKFPRKRTAFGYAFSLRIFQWDTTAFPRIDPRHWLGGSLRNVFRFPLLFALLVFAGFFKVSQKTGW